MRIVLLGAPGSGKGTQGQMLSQHYGVPHIATGDIIRDHIARHTEFGQSIEAAIAQGNFAPDKEMLFWVLDRMAQPDAHAGYLLDGFPRDLVQAEMLDTELQRNAAILDAVIELRLTEETVIERLAGRWVCPTCDEIYHLVHRPPKRPGLCDNDGTPLVRRPDDEPAAIRTRMQVYETRTLPVRAYYEQRHLLKSVDAGAGVSETFDRILKVLEAA